MFDFASLARGYPEEKNALDASMVARDIALADDTNHQQFEYYHITIISLFCQTPPSEVTLVRVQFEGFQGTLRGTTLIMYSTIRVQKNVNMLFPNILNLAIWSTYYVVAVRPF